MFGNWNSIYDALGKRIEFGVYPNSRISINMRPLNANYRYIIIFYTNNSKYKAVFYKAVDSTTGGEASYQTLWTIDK